MNLHATISSSQLLDPQLVLEAALKIDDDLETWRAGVSSDWRYITVEAPQHADPECYDGKTHVYPSLWVAEIWNSWRALRILVNQLVVQHGTCLNETEVVQGSRAVLNICETSVDLCISVFSFTGTPRMFPMLIERRDTDGVLQVSSLSSGR